MVLTFGFTAAHLTTHSGALDLSAGTGGNAWQVMAHASCFRSKTDDVVGEDVWLASLLADVHRDLGVGMVSVDRSK